jgi:hypothetical protein
MRYRVEVAVGDYLSGSLWVDADSPEAARGKAEGVIKNAAVEAVGVWGVDVGDPVPVHAAGSTAGEKP